MAFALVTITHSLARADHSLVSMPISALSAGPSGWVQNVNFVGLGVLLLTALAAQLRRSTRSAVTP
ncbi:MAG: DUF998 domain-containing protein [Pseudonocardiaceae bacterium]|nr:DUF998 domain-containing protein [Pseudonocardiaceae bacterium]